MIFYQNSNNIFPGHVSRILIFRALAVIYFLCPITYGCAGEVEIPSSFNPVGSGARAIGMGGAFIAVADDATSASWNPGGLIQLKKPEFSVVASLYHRKEDNNFRRHPEASGLRSISEEDMNYFSAAYPFLLFNRNMVLSLSYQHLYDFARKWDFVLTEKADNSLSEDRWNFQQKGRLSALGLSWCIRVSQKFSAGFTLNFWDHSLTGNKWEQTYRKRGLVTEDYSFTTRLDMTKIYSFSGFNANLGILWKPIDNLTIGAVLKTPFKAEIVYQSMKKTSLTYHDLMLSFANQDSPPSFDTKNEELEMPMSYGIGFVYDFSTNFSVSADIFRTEWDDFVYRTEEGDELSPVSGVQIARSDVKPAHQVRMGAEYRVINVNKKYVVPVRCGIFYDPAPAEGSPDDFRGFSLGIGFTKNNRYSLERTFFLYVLIHLDDVAHALYVCCEPSDVGYIENLKLSEKVEGLEVYYL